MHGFMISFHCRPELFERLESFAIRRNIDRTSVLKLALHFHLNRLMASRKAPRDAPATGSTAAPGAAGAAAPAQPPAAEA